MSNTHTLLKFLASLLLSTAFFFALNTAGLLQPSAPAVGAFLDPFAGFWRQAEPLGTPPELDLRSNALSHPVAVVYDERRVPHIFAETAADAAFAQGYLMARDRLWQMDMVVRAIGGRLSEILGESALEYDRQMRRYGMARSAQADYAYMRNYPYDHRLALAYADGVNAYIDDLRPRDYPLEFKLLGYAPESWDPSNYNLLHKYMAMDLCFQADDLAATNALKLFGRERFDFLFPRWNPRQSPVIPEAVEWDFEPLALESAPDPPMISQFLPSFDIPRPDRHIGSNNWAVSGARTSSGHPILANDPHLGLNLPSIWYELQIHTPEFNAYGVGLPCVPGIVIGFNEHLAWGVTNVGHDVLDFYQIAWQDSSKQAYMLDGELRPVELVEERIKVKGREEAVVEPVRYTHWGPVVESFRGMSHPDLALRWLGNQQFDQTASSSIGVFYNLMQARDYGDYEHALRSYTYPAQNFVMAQREGDIALKVNGWFPLRHEEQGRFLLNGSKTNNAWQGYIPYEHIPQVRNPARGWVSSANQHSTDPSYPYYYHARFEDYRGRYINRVLGQDSVVSVEDAMALQNDNYSLFAEDALPVFLRRLDRSTLDDTQKQRLAELEAWDKRFTADDWRPTLMDRWYSEIRRLSLDEWETWNDSIPVLSPEAWRLLELLDQYPEDILFDLAATPQRENADELVTRAFRQAVGPDGQEIPPWGEAKKTTLQHLGRIGAFSIPVTVGGSGDAPNAVSERHGPSWRMVVELGPEIKAYGVFPGGQSGNPGSPFYDNSVSTWASGEYHELFFMRGPDDRRQPVLGRYSMTPEQFTAAE